MQIMQKKKKPKLWVINTSAVLPRWGNATFDAALRISHHTPGVAKSYDIYYKLLRSRDHGDDEFRYEFEITAFSCTKGRETNRPRRK